MIKKFLLIILALSCTKQQEAKVFTGSIESMETSCSIELLEEKTIGTDHDLNKVFTVKVQLEDVSETFNLKYSPLVDSRSNVIDVAQSMLVDTYAKTKNKLIHLRVSLSQNSNKFIPTNYSYLEDGKEKIFFNCLEIK